jgi:glycosyltransferase involved in cell wall biosynthesis
MNTLAVPNAPALAAEARAAAGPAGEPRVVFVIPNLARMGADFSPIVRALAAEGVASAVYAPPPSGRPEDGWDGAHAVDTFLSRFPQGTQLHTQPFDRLRLRAGGVLRTAAQAFRMADRYPDAVFILIGQLPVAFCGPPLRLRGRRCIFLLCGLGSAFGGSTPRMRAAGRVLLRLYRFLCAGEGTRIITHNHEDRAFLADRLRLDPARITVTGGCGIDPEVFPYLPPTEPAEKKVVYAPMRLLKEKGVWDAVGASRILRERGVDHELWFSATIDPGNPSSLTEADVERIRRENPQIRFVGWHPSTLPLYRAAHVVCIPTAYREGLPTVVLESAACGRPMVASDNVGCRDFVEDGRTGLVVPTGAPEALADALARILADGALAERLRAEAHRRFLDGFTKDEMVRRTLRVLGELGMDLPGARAAA